MNTQRKPPLREILEDLAFVQLPKPKLEEWCRNNPPKRDHCRWCGQNIISTPWFSPTGNFHIDSGGWMHEDTEYSPCGPSHPYRFAEPTQTCQFCGHRMAEHHLFKGSYEQPAPEVSCVFDGINPRTLTTCGCEGSNDSGI